MVANAVLSDPNDSRIAASDMRKQAARAICIAWKEHFWPERERILEVFQRVTYNLDIIQSARYPIHRQRIQTNLEGQDIGLYAKVVREK